MKKLILFTLVIINGLNLLAQDIITKKNGEDIKAKVLEVTQNEIKYKRFESVNGPTYTISKSELILVRFEDGTKEIFNDKNITVTTGSDEDMFKQGRNDANAYYKGQNCGSGWTAATTILTTPIAGGIVAAICASNEPSEDNLNYRSKELMNNEAYSRSYKEQAHKIKKRKIWTAFGIGSGAWLLLSLLLL